MSNKIKKDIYKDAYTLMSTARATTNIFEENNLNVDSINSKRDDGLIVGSVHQLATMELLYQVYKDGYDGVIYFDTFPDSTGLDPVKECEANIGTVKKMLEVVKKLSGDNNLKHAIANQDSITSNQIFNKALYNLNSS